MEVKTTFISQEDFGEEFGKTILKLENIYNDSGIVLSEHFYPMKKDSYHFIGHMLKNLSKANRAEQAIASQIFRAVYQAELTSAGSGHLAFLFALEVSKKFRNKNFTKENEVKAKKEYEIFINKFQKSVIDNANVANEKNIKDVIRKICNDKALSVAIWEAVKLAGLEGQIFVENGKQENYVIEFKEGYNFPLKSFNWMLNNGNWERTECKALVVDGLVEKVSEIDQLLSKAHELQQPLLIIALGFSEEVAATIKANNDRKLLDVQLTRIPPGLDGLNVVNDISTVVGTLPVSSMKGDLITFVKWENLPTVDKIRLTNEKIVLENNKTKAAVSNQIKHLIEKRQENYLYEDVQTIFDKRIRSLVSNSVSILLPDSTTMNSDALKMQIDIALRQVKTIINYGTVNFCKAVESMEATTDMSIVLCSSLKAMKLPELTVPTLSAIMGVTLAGRAVLSLLLSSGFVEIIS